MKILGKTNIGFIVEMGAEELAKVRGYSSTYCKSYLEPEVGGRFMVSDAWDLLEDMRKRRDSLRKISGDLRAYADLLTWKEDEIFSILYQEEKQDG